MIKTIDRFLLTFLSAYFSAMQIVQAALAQSFQISVAYQAPVKVQQPARLFKGFSKMPALLAESFLTYTSFKTYPSDPFYAVQILQTLSAELSQTDVSYRIVVKVSQLVRQFSKNLFIQQLAGLFKSFSKAPVVQTDILYLRASLNTSHIETKISLLPGPIA